MLSCTQPQPHHNQICGEFVIELVRRIDVTSHANVTNCDQQRRERLDFVIVILYLIHTISASGIYK